MWDIPWSPPSALNRFPPTATVANLGLQHPTASTRNPFLKSLKRYVNSCIGFPHSYIRRRGQGRTGIDDIMAAALFCCVMSCLPRDACASRLVDKHDYYVGLGWLTNSVYIYIYKRRCCTTFIFGVDWEKCCTLWMSSMVSKIWTLGCPLGAPCDFQ